MMVLSNYGVAQFEVFTNESCFCLHSLLERKKKFVAKCIKQRIQTCSKNTQKKIDKSCTRGMI